MDTKHDNAGTRNSRSKKGIQAGSLQNGAAGNSQSETLRNGEAPSFDSRSRGEERIDVETRDLSSSQHLGQTPDRQNFISVLRGASTKQARAIEELTLHLDSIQNEHGQLDQLLKEWMGEWAKDPMKPPIKEQIATPPRGELAKKQEKGLLEYSNNKIDEVATLTAMNSSLKDQVTKLEGELKAARDEKDSSSKEVASLREMNAELEKRIATIQRPDPETERLKAQLAHTQNEYNRFDQLSKERAAEHSGAQVFLGTTDSISETEVVRMVQLLNVEAHRLSALVAGSLAQQTFNKIKRVEFDQALDYVKSLVGQRFKDELCNACMRSRHSTTSQIVLQSGLINACFYAIREWNPPSRDSHSNMENVYNAIRSTEGQAIAGRWRALAYSHISAQPEKNDIHKNITGYLNRVFRSLLTAISWSTRVPIPPEYENRIDTITKKVLDIRDVVWKGITSVDLQAHIIPFEERFSPNLMDDAYGDGGDGPVLCTIEMGLFQRSKNPNSPDPEQRKSWIILKPKVMRLSALTDKLKVRNAANT